MALSYMILFVLGKYGTVKLHSFCNSSYINVILIHAQRCCSRKDFGIIIGMEKNDNYKVYNLAYFHHLSSSVLTFAVHYLF